MVMPRVGCIALGASLLLGCPARVEDDGTGAGTSGTATDSGSTDSSLSASNTSATMGTDPGTDPSTGETTAVADSSTGPASCDPDTCESLDLEACEACPEDDLNGGCTLLYGWLWTEQEGEWCTGEIVPLGCKLNGVCFDYSPTACDRTGDMYYLDNICPEIDFATLGLELCDPPSDVQGMCPAP